MNKPDLKEYTKSYCIYAQERSGVSGKAFFRRGLPFAEGILKDEKQFYLKGEDEKIPDLQTKVIERYSDGSIKWLSVAFAAELEAYQSYRLDGVFKKRTDTVKLLAKEEKGIVLENDKFKVTVKDGKVASIISEGKEVLGKNGISLSVKNDEGKHLFNAEEAKIYVNGSIYAVARLKGRFADTNAYADWFITIYADDLRISHMVKFSSKDANVFSAQLIETELADEFKNTFCRERVEHNGNLYLSDWACSETENGTNVVMTTTDVKRFHKAMAPTGVHNGFEISGNHITFAPIQYDIPFLWPDGVMRTAHLEMSFSQTEGAKLRAENEKKRIFENPVLTIPSKWFVAMGALDDDSKSEVITRHDRLLASMYGFYWNHFEAGKLPNGLKVDFVSEKVTAPATVERSHGEINYAILKAYMNSSDPKLFDLNNDVTEHWTDIIQYHGMHKELEGANRYHSGDFFNDNLNFCVSMPYYGDLSGLYLTYCMTGDPYIEERFRSGIDFIVESTKLNGVPILSYWSTEMYAVHKSPEFQFRCCSITRALYFAYSLYGKKCYKEAAESINHWLYEGQSADGSFYEDYYYDTKQPFIKYINGKIFNQLKTYIMTFGARAVSEYCRMSGDETAISVMERLAKYFIDNMDPRGFMWSPTNSGDEYGVSNNKSSCVVTSSGAACFLAHMYEVTQNPIYFITVLKLWRFCISIWGSKGGSGQLQGSQVPSIIGMQTASKMIKENLDFVLLEGFADVAAALHTDTKQTYGVYPCHNHLYERFVINTFDTLWGNLIYFNYRKSPVHGDTSENIAFDFDFEISNDRRLWYGETISVNDKSGIIALHKTLREVEIIQLLQTDIVVSDMTGDAELEIIKYTRDEIRILLRKGSGFKARVTNGFFHVKDGEKYTISQYTRVIEETAKDGVLEFEVIPGYDTEITISRNM